MTGAGDGAAGARRLFQPDRVLVDGAFQEGLAVETAGETITAVIPVGESPGPAPPGPPPETVALPGQALMPGTVNVHAHAFQSLLRGFGDDLPFLEWRDRSLYRWGATLDVEGIYTGSLFAFCEMLRAGITTVAEFFYLHGAGLEGDRAVRRAAGDAGIRLVLARTFYDGQAAPPSFRERLEDAAARCRDLMDECAGDARVQVVPAPHSVHAASPAMIQAAHALARERRVPLHIHVAEQPFEVEECRRQHGVTPLRFLDGLGVVDDSMLLVHGCHLDEGEKDLMAERGVRLAHCPGANLFLADGVADLPGFRRRGVLVGLGTDGGCVNSRLSLFDEMRLAAVLQKGVRQDATAVTASEALAMGTWEGGEALGLPVGRIAPGQPADFVALDLEDPSLAPVQNLRQNLIYSMMPQAITRVVVGGETVFHGGDTVRVPLAEVTARVRRLTRAW